MGNMAYHTMCRKRCDLSNSNIRFKGQIRTYIMWPLWMTILVIVFALAMYFVDIRAGVMATAFAVIYAGVAYFLYFHNRNRVWRSRQTIVNRTPTRSTCRAGSRGSTISRFTPVPLWDRSTCPRVWRASEQTRFHSAPPFPGSVIGERKPNGTRLKKVRIGIRVPETIPWLAPTD